MEFIKKWFNPYKKGRKDKNNTKEEHRVSSLLESLSSTQEQTRGSSGRRNAICVSKTNFIPRTQGHEATVAYLESGSASDLSQLLSERDRAERLVYQGPKTKATQEVQDILREPSITTVGRFHRVYKQAEILIKYGIAGEIVYNFSRSPSWNKANISRLPSLQLKNFSDIMKRHIGLPSNTSSIPRSPSTPIDWIVLGASGSTAPHDVRRPSIVSEPGGWRDLPPLDTNDERMGDVHSPSSVAQDSNLEDEWEIEEAQILTVTRVPIRQVHITPKRGSIESAKVSERRELSGRVLDNSEGYSGC
ncbi:uncharacterized protein F4807DRAFT_133980 [Annulohypoxylon truncatum]|uniref:uncharacterized protein n=1 Tax=Annulohypoxylon truncatum TaxID=327061 RepID=UPI00200723B9|nr:uncharacterized protein F4807DRAFT_133980 [Annulohypoxylon truncatum]KAI1208782.1 hypothetical protein F4807DRAFT_133980 [Annulohypoxylon truncatum]